MALPTPTRIQLARYARNGLVPHAAYESSLAASENFVVSARTKHLFHGFCPLASIPSSTYTSRSRWRFAAHTGPMLRRLGVRVLVALQNSGDPIATAATVRVYITDASGSAYGSGAIAVGHNPGGPAPVGTPNEYTSGVISISGVPADTDIYGRFDDGDSGARLISATVYEESLPVSTANGYAPAAAATGPIYDARRETMYELGTAMWKRGAAHLFNWTVDDQASPRTVSNGTAKNVVDNAATGAAGPRWALDMRYCRTLTRSTVPTALKVYAKMSGTGDTGELWFSGVSAGYLATIQVSGTTAQWYSTTIDLPATQDQYFLEFLNPDASETLSVYAASLFQHA